MERGVCQGFLLFFLMLSEWWIFLKRIWRKGKSGGWACLLLNLGIAEFITVLLTVGVFWWAGEMAEIPVKTGKVVSAFGDRSILKAVVAGYVRLAVIMLILVVKEKRYRRWFGTVPVIVALFQILLAGSYLWVCEKVDGVTIWLILIMLLTCILIDTMLLKIADNMVRIEQEEKKLLGLETQRKQELLFYEKDSQYVKELRMVQHDFANQMQILYHLVKSGEDWETIDKIAASAEARLKEITLGK